MSFRPLPRSAAWMLIAAGGALSLACLAAIIRFGFLWVLAWWLALSLSAAYAGWSLTRDQDV
jgi:hypothetical protein